MCVFLALSRAVVCVYFREHLVCRVCWQRVCLGNVCVTCTSSGERRESGAWAWWGWFEGPSSQPPPGRKGSRPAPLYRLNEPSTQSLGLTPGMLNGGRKKKFKDTKRTKVSSLTIFSLNFFQVKIRKIRRSVWFSPSLVGSDSTQHISEIICCLFHHVNQSKISEREHGNNSHPSWLLHAGWSCPPLGGWRAAGAAASCLLMLPPLPSHSHRASSPAPSHHKDWLLLLDVLMVEKWQPPWLAHNHQYGDYMSKHNLWWLNCGDRWRYVAFFCPSSI